MERCVDIIVPVYNAFDDLKECVSSIFEHTNMNRNRLILVNDKSSDERVATFLETLKRKNVIVIHNQVNRGFSANINLGIEQSEYNDVVLLNSDTIVSAGWLDKLKKCADSREEIGTVTPLSNNATLCSVPVLFHENELPEQISVAKAAEIVEKCSLHKYPEIAVAHGFCMYIKRKLINKIGYFDEKAFGKGYGEENDFCNRAIQLGYTNVMCDDTYIFHKGTKSFITKEKEKLIADHERLLYQRYPAQMKKLEKYCESNPNRLLGENINIYFSLNNNKKNLLLVLQEEYDINYSTCIGGTQLHVYSLVQSLKNKYNFFIAYRKENSLEIKSLIDEKQFEFLFALEDQSNNVRLRNYELRNIWTNIIKAFQINLVHVHHTKNIGIDIFDVADSLNIPVLYTIHDFYCVCPYTTLMDYKGKDCHNTNNEQECRICLNRRYRIYEGLSFIENWRSEYENVLRKCRLIIAPTESARNILQNYYRIPDEKVKIVEHGYGVKTVNKQYTDLVKYISKSEFIIVESNHIYYTFKANLVIKEEKIAIIRNLLYFRAKSENEEILIPVTGQGEEENLGKSKTCICYGMIPKSKLKYGTKWKIELGLRKGNLFSPLEVKILRSRKADAGEEKAFRVAFIGGINRIKGSEEVLEIINSKLEGVEWFLLGSLGDDRLKNVSNRMVYKSGMYRPQDIGILLKNLKIDLVCLLSKCPETFSYTLSDAIAAKIPVVVTNIGALEERVHRLQNGWIVSCDNSVKETVELIDRIKNRGEEYSEKLKRARNLNVIDVKSMTDKYESIYDKEAVWPKIDADFDAKFIFDAYVRGTYGSDEVLISSNNENALTQCLTYKILNKIAAIPFPYKENVRIFMLKLLVGDELTR